MLDGFDKESSSRRLYANSGYEKLHVDEAVIKPTLVAEDLPDMRTVPGASKLLAGLSRMVISCNRCCMESER